MMLAIKPGLCLTWSETMKTGFLAMRLYVGETKTIENKQLRPESFFLFEVQSFFVFSFCQNRYKPQVIFHTLSVFTSSTVYTATSFDLDKSRCHLINMQLNTVV